MYRIAAAPSSPTSAGRTQAGSSVRPRTSARADGTLTSDSPVAALTRLPSALRHSLSVVASAKKAIRHKQLFGPAGGCSLSGLSILGNRVLRKEDSRFLRGEGTLRREPAARGCGVGHVRPLAARARRASRTSTRRPPKRCRTCRSSRRPTSTSARSDPPPLPGMNAGDGPPADRQGSRPLRRRHRRDRGQRRPRNRRGRCGARLRRLRPAAGRRQARRTPRRTRCCSSRRPARTSRPAPARPSTTSSCSTDCDVVVIGHDRSASAWRRARSSRARRRRGRRGRPAHRSGSRRRRPTRTASRSPGCSGSTRSRSA